MPKDFLNLLGDNPASLFMSQAPKPDPIKEEQSMEENSLSIDQSVKMKFEIEPSITKNQRISLAVTPELREKIVLVSQKYHISINNLIHKILENFFNNVTF